jgi:small subunit ribosomal protein S9
MTEQLSYYATGRRKKAVARVWLLPGGGNIVVNKKDFKEYFNRVSLQKHIKDPLLATNMLDKFDVKATVKGGGISGQAGALRHGIARALVNANPELKSILSKGKYITRDPRMHERKKYGRAGRRKSFQYSKR